MRPCPIGSGNEAGLPHIVPRMSPIPPGPSVGKIPCAVVRLSATRTADDGQGGTLDLELDKDLNMEPIDLVIGGQKPLVAHRFGSIFLDVHRRL